MTLTPEQTAATYLKHLENREWDQARSMCAADATVWHSDGKGDAGIDENIAGMKDQIGSITSMRYAIQRQISQGDEILQQHVVRVETVDGTRMNVYAAVYFRLNDGLIERIEEYANAVPDSDSAS